MNKRTALGALVIVSLALLPQVVSAVLPTLIWTVNRQAGDFIDALGNPDYDEISTSSLLKLEVDAQGRAAWSLHLDDGGARDVFDDTILVYNQAGAVSDRHDTRCASSTGQDTCRFAAMAWDRLDKLWVVASEDHDQAGTAQASHPVTPGEACSQRVPGSTTPGAICNLTWNITAETNPTVTNDVGPRQITVFKRNDTSQGYIVDTGAEMFRIPSSFTGTREAQFSTTNDQVFANTTGPVGWGLDEVAGPSITYRRFDLEGMTVTHTETGPAILSNTGRMAINTTSTNEVVYAYATSLASGVVYDAMPQDDLDPITTTTPTNNRIWFDGSLRNMNVADFDLDQAGSMLVCGQFATGSETNAYVMNIDMVSKVQVWNLTIDLGTFTEARSCQFDHTGGFYVQLIYQDSSTNRGQLRRYEGGGFSAPSPDELIEDSSIQPPTTTAPAIGGAVGFRDFCLAVGFTDAPGKFLCGLVIVMTGSVLVAFVLANRTKDGMARLGRTSLFGAGGTFLGLSMFVTFVELWPIISLFLMIVLAAAIVAVVAKRTFGEGGQ